MSLVSVEDARARILDLLGETPGGQPETVVLDAALGRVAAERVTARVSLPPWDNAAMDGYAVRAADVVAATDANPARLQVSGEVAAGGSARVEVVSGMAVRIATGAAVPRGADAVVEVESTTAVGAGGAAGTAGAAEAVGSRGRDATGPLPAAVLVHRAVGAGGNIRRAASDISAGDVVLEPGTAIGPPQIALLGGSGIAEIAVFPRPRVAVLATGEEVRAPGEPLGEAGIPDANGPGLRALVTRAGAVAIDLGIARDDVGDVLGRLRRGIEAGCDAIVVAGGVSVGPYDVVRSAFGQLGRVDLWRVAVQPGKPFALAVVEASSAGASSSRARPVLLFGLPGNPVSGFVTFELFVRPAIRALAGRRHLGRPLDRAVLLDEARTSPGRRAYLRVRAERDATGGTARDDRGRVLVRLAHGPAGQGSHVLSALAAAEALAIVPEGVEVHPSGDPVDLLWLDVE